VCVERVESVEWPECVIKVDLFGLLPLLVVYVLYLRVRYLTTP
jgi:hypothetical protein